MWRPSGGDLTVTADLTANQRQGAGDERKNSRDDPGRIEWIKST